MLPEGWSEIALEDLANVERGKFSARPRNDSKFYNGTTPFVQTGDVSSSDTYLREYTQTLNDEGVKVSKIFPKGTILVTIAANIGDSAIAEFDVACPDSVVGIQCYQEKSNNIWLKFKIDTIKKNLDNEAGKNAQKNINLQLLKPLKIWTPPRPEQEKIAAVLSTWDKAISTTDALLANCRQQKKALMQQLLTGKRRLPGFTGEWYHACLGKIAHIEKGKPLTGSSIIKGEIPVIAGGKTVSAWHNDFTHNTVITVSASGAYAGFVSFHKYKIWASDCSVINGICNISLSQYLYYLLLFKQKEIYSLQTGGAQPHVYPKDLAKLTCSLPPLDEQCAIAAVLDVADREIVLLEQKAARLREEKKALMQQLLTGKRRVRL